VRLLRDVLGAQGALQGNKNAAKDKAGNKGSQTTFDVGRGAASLLGNNMRYQTSPEVGIFAEICLREGRTQCCGTRG